VEKKAQPVASHEWDVFISHATEDKAEFARPLADGLRARGVSVWYDEFSLKVGDRLRESIDRGLGSSRFGVVILSPYFFAKDWPARELSGLATREEHGQKVILPVWYRVGFEEVRAYSPPLADRIAVKAENGLGHVIEKLLDVIQPTPVLSITETTAIIRHLESLLAAKTEELHSLTNELTRSYDNTLQLLGDALDLKDSETEGHSRRVTAFTIAIARAMGVPRNQILMIARGAFLHDIGKMTIPDKVLFKPGKLDDGERAIMREHCYNGYQMLKKIDFLKEAAEIVYAHQEHYDGTGFPRGLKGNEIPLGARIFSVADTLDAITSDRPYRAARSITAARKEIQAWNGRQFDPEVVKVFLSMPDGIFEDLGREINSQSFPFK
jgi:putative nucleotidyltransferase with HDIG domain